MVCIALLFASFLAWVRERLTLEADDLHRLELHVFGTIIERRHLGYLFDTMSLSLRGRSPGNQFLVQGGDGGRKQNSALWLKRWGERERIYSVDSNGCSS